MLINAGNVLRHQLFCFDTVYERLNQYNQSISPTGAVHKLKQQQTRNNAILSKRLVI